MAFLVKAIKRKAGFGGLEEKLKLYGFNNLTKALSFNIYDICYAKSAREQQDYIKYIDEQYNSERLTKILSTVTEMIGARILNIAKQDYDPQGASVTMLIAEEEAVESGRKKPVESAILGDTILAHLDKSHVTVHTYPEFHPGTSIATFRVDIDVATCGEITPLKTLDYMIAQFDSDIITMDYRVRGFTRDLDGRKLFMDSKMRSGDARPLRRRRHQPLSGESLPHAHAHQGAAAAELPVQHGHLRDPAEGPPRHQQQPAPRDDRDLQRP